MDTELGGDNPRCVGEAKTSPKIIKYKIPPTYIMIHEGNSCVRYILSSTCIAPLWRHWGDVRKGKFTETSSGIHTST